MGDHKQSARAIILCRSKSSYLILNSILLFESRQMTESAKSFLPIKMILIKLKQVAIQIGESKRWTRFQKIINRWRSDDSSQDLSKPGRNGNQVLAARLRSDEEHFRDWRDWHQSLTNYTQVSFANQETRFSLGKICSRVWGCTVKSTPVSTALDLFSPRQYS